MGLKQQDQSTVQRGANGEVLAMGAVKLYLAQPDPNSWTDSGIVGGAAVVSSRGQHFIRIVDFQSQAVVFEQEFYAGMEYNSSAGFFHMLELSDCVGGFCFADDAEADKFAAAVQSVCSPSRSPPPPQPSRPAPPEPARDHSPTVHVTSSPSPPPTASTTPTLTSSQRGSATNVSSPAPKEKKKAGFSLSKGFNSLKQKFKGDSGPDPANFSISGPSGFRHDSHIGWDPENGFEIRNIPPAWRQLFQDAGVKKKDLKDANTAKFIMETVAAACGGDPSSIGAPSGGHSGGGGGGGGPAPPPPPGPPPPPAPGPPPPPSAHGGPASGPAGGGGGGRGGLLAQIQAGTTLKTVEDSGGLPDLNNMDEQGRNNLTNTLANALALRRADMVASDGDDDGDEGWDEWDG